MEAKKTMSSEAKRMRSAYMKQWRRKNADKQRNYLVDFWERKAAKDKERGKAPEQLNLV